MRHSVLFEGTEIGRGATVVDSVVLPGARVGASSRLRGVILDAGCLVPEGAVIERDDSTAEPIVLTNKAGCAATYALG